MYRINFCVCFGVDFSAKGLLFTTAVPPFPKFSLSYPNYASCIPQKGDGVVHIRGACITCGISGRTNQRNGSPGLAATDLKFGNFGIFDTTG
jgi:hypothetical protein